MKPWMGAFIRTLASRFGGLEEERRTRTHSVPSVSASLPIVPASGPVVGPVVGPVAASVVSPVQSPLNTTYRSPPNSKLTGPSDSPLNARPGTQWHTGVTGGGSGARPSQGFETSAVPEDRSDVTVVADLMAESGGSDDDPSLATGGESVMIDLGDDDESGPVVGVTISTPADAEVSGVEDEAEDADTRLIGPWTRKPPPPRE